MGKRGPAPAPTAVKLLRGETRPSRVNYGEPKPGTRPPRVPASLSPEARKVWRDTMAAMGPTHVITAADAVTLRLYCEAVVRYAEAMRLYAMAGPVIKSGGSVAKNPLHQIVRENSDLTLRLARELGLTPSARSGLTTGNERGVDQVEADIGLPPRLRAVGADG